MRLRGILAPLACACGVFAAQPPDLSPPDKAPRGLVDAVVCRLTLDPHNKFTRVPAPRRGSWLTTGAATSTFIANYTAFPPEAQAAFQAAMDIWSTQVSSTVPIVVDAHMTDQGIGPLASAIPLGISAFAASPKPGVEFPMAIANRLSGRDLNPNPNPAHLFVLVNSSAPWYYGTDGVPHAGQVDFMTVALHELGHGLGFHGTVAYTNGLPHFNAIPSIYDVNVVSGGGISVLNETYLDLVLRGNSLFWNGPNGLNATGRRPRLHAPSVFASGTSFTHLDESTYPAGDANSVMTSSIGFAEVAHSPGPIALGMFADMGWAGVGVAPCTYSLSAPGAEVSNLGFLGAVTLHTQLGCRWIASSGDPNVFVSPTSGSGSAAIQYFGSATARTITLTIAGLSFSIVPQARPCIFSLSATGAVAGSAGGTGSIGLTGAPACAWTATSSNPSVATIAPPSGSGNAILTYSLAPNTTGSPRSAVLTIGGQAYAITQSAQLVAAAQAPAIVSQPADAEVAVGEIASFQVVASGIPEVVYKWQWQPPGQSAFGDIISGFGNPSVATLFVFFPDVSLSGSRFRCVVSNSAGTLTSAPVTLTVADPVTAAPRSLIFGAAVDGSRVIAHTPAQIVRLTKTFQPDLTWTATSGAPWLQVAIAEQSPSAWTSGAGTADLKVSVTPGAAPAILTGSITLTAYYSGGILARTIPVSLRSTVLGRPPTGSFDTPASGTKGITGSIAVTGWALDDVGVSRVTICRDAAAGESAGFNPDCDGPRVYVGDAVFVDGARPDVQTASPALPLNTRGGWGYMMLTNFLPNGGNGTFTLHAYAKDFDGHSTELGTKVITVDNLHATAPFGAIDTPAQGEVICGAYLNFGWTLTQPPKDVAADSSTITVFIDGQPVGHPSPRASRSDISSLFTAYDTTHAVGGFAFDTAAYANGLHTIFWIVTDTDGRTDGIGSRFFGIVNPCVPAAGGPR